MIVDASVAVKWFLAEEHSDIARAILTSGAKLYAPDVIFPEVLGAMVKAHRVGRIGEEDSLASLPLLESALETAYPFKALASRAFEIAAASGAYVFDSLYLAAADISETLLVTADDRFIEAIRPFEFARRIVALKEWVGE